MQNRAGALNDSVVVAASSPRPRAPTRHRSTRKRQCLRHRSRPGHLVWPPVPYSRSRGGALFNIGHFGTEPHIASMRKTPMGIVLRVPLEQPKRLRAIQILNEVSLGELHSVGSRECQLASPCIMPWAAAVPTTVTATLPAVTVANKSLPVFTQAGRSTVICVTSQLPLAKVAAQEVR